MSDLAPLERLRVLAAMGGEVTLDADLIRSILAQVSAAKIYERSGHAAYKDAIDLYRKSRRQIIAMVVVMLAWTAFIVVIV